MTSINQDDFTNHFVINCVADILSGKENPSKVTSLEEEILKRSDEIRILDSNLNGELLQILEESSNFVPPDIALRLLLRFDYIERLKDAQRILSFCVLENMTFTEEDLGDLVAELEKDENSNMELWMSVFARDYEEKKVELPEVPMLNLPKDFK